MYSQAIHSRSSHIRYVYFREKVTLNMANYRRNIMERCCLEYTSNFHFYQSKINVVVEYYQENAKDKTYVNIWVVVCVYI